MTNNDPKTPILPSDREYLIERRRAIMLELDAIERRLGLPSSVRNKDERRADAYAQRIRETIKQGEG